MDSGTEVLRITAAIVSAFQTAADTLETIKTRKEKRKRKKDKEVEELLEIRILHTSLVEGGTRCRRHCENRHRQFSPAFEAGDPIAILALKDIVVSLQTEVIQALHVARAVENAVLDFTSLHESSVSNRKDATRAMDQLCQRITASMQFQSQQGLNISGPIFPSNASIRPSFTSIPVSDLNLNESNDYPPSPPSSIGSPPQRSYQRVPSFPQTLNVRRPSDTMSQRGAHQAHRTSPLSWISSQVDLSSGDPTTGNAPSTAAGEEQQQRQQQQQSYQSLGGWEAEQRREHSQENQGPWELEESTHSSPQIQEDKEIENNDQSSIQSSIQFSAQGMGPNRVQMQPTIPSSTTITQYPQDPGSTGSQAVSEQLPQYSQQEITPGSRPATLASATHRRSAAGSFDDGAHAPEVVPSPEMIRPPSEQEKYPAVDYPQEKHPALRTPQLTPFDHTQRLLSLPTGMEEIWTPLARPAMHNRYHGFCKGAWEIRKAAHEGLEVQTGPSLKEPVVYWGCKGCKFRLRAPSADAHPNQIVVNEKYGVLYRWLFLAKSHRATESSCDVAESYKYGCIFCAAQGQATAVHNKLDHLLVHIISKHKFTMMTRDIRERTKCVVGSVPDEKEDWDISISVSNQKGAGVVADEFLISASKLFSRKGKPWKLGRK